MSASISKKISVTLNSFQGPWMLNQVQHDVLGKVIPLCAFAPLREIFFFEGSHKATKTQKTVREAAN